MSETSEINFRRAQFLISAPSLHLCPPETGAEVAFAGRSNAGKSSAINCLTGNGKLARTSKTPGRTQLINFFSLGNPDLRLVDLPGYGYARVPKQVKEEWQRHLSDYLYERESLKGLVLVMDIRHPLQEFDTLMINWAVERSLPVHLLLTKSDKLKSGAMKNAVQGVRKHIREAGVEDLVSTQHFSALKSVGVDVLEATLIGWLGSSAGKSSGGEKNPEALGEPPG